MECLKRTRTIVENNSPELLVLPNEEQLSAFATSRSVVVRGVPKKSGLAFAGDLQSPTIYHINGNSIRISMDTSDLI